jgi:predicted transcriptional regulator
MSKLSQIGVRFEPEQREALDRIAAEQQRPVSSVVRLAVSEWLAEKAACEEPQKQAA